ncbi:MAG TPA: ABC transporter ATP-binding protein [Gammaproteobacteria bacterium]
MRLDMSKVSNGDALLLAAHLSKQVSSPDGVLTILDDVSLAIRRGESVAIVGPSGSGKSTLLGLLAGLDVPSSGEVWLDGEPFSSLDEDARAERRAHEIGFVFQSFHLLPGLTALENVMLPLELGDGSGAEAAAREVLDAVGLGARARYYPQKLSGGEQQRVAIARAYATRPHLLFADEPTGNLDAATGHVIVDLLFKLNAERTTTLVLVTHDQELAGRCDRVLRLHAGRLEPAA